MQKLGILKKINLRQFWPHEANDFTKWLAKNENIKLLNDELNFIDIKVIKTEANVGNFSADILAEDANNPDHKIIIENQFDKTNHDHLGKIITYAAGYDAKTIIWIVENVREEHKKAIDWLNENIDDVDFFIVKAELWQINDSDYAPKFSVIVSPNQWLENTRNNLRNIKLTDLSIKQKKFWDSFIQYSLKNNFDLKLSKAQYKQYYDIFISNKYFHISFLINSKKQTLSCAIYIRNCKELFYFLEAQKDEIENIIKDNNLEWLELPSNKASLIKINTKFNLDDEINWSKHFKWMIEKYQIMTDTFIKYSSKFNQNFDDNNY